MVLRRINKVLESHGLRPSGRIDKGLSKLEKFCLIEYLNIKQDDFYKLKEGKLIVMKEALPWPLNYIYLSNPEIHKKSESKLRLFLANQKICFEGIKPSQKELRKLYKVAESLDVSNYQECFHYFSILRLYSSYCVKKFTRKELTENKITLSQIVSNAIEHLRSSDKDFLLIQYKTPKNIHVRQQIAENYEGIALYNQFHKKIVINKHLYNKNAVLFFPSRSSDRIHDIYLYNIPVNSEKFNPYFDWSRFYVRSTVEYKNFLEISATKKSNIPCYITAPETASLIWVFLNLKETKFTTPILLPDKNFRKKIGILKKSLVYDPVFRDYRALNKAELEMYSVRLLKYDSSLKLMSEIIKKEKKK